MKRFIGAFFTIVASVTMVNAQPFNDSINNFRQHYKQDFLTDAHSPLKADDTAFLCFYKPDPSFSFIATFKATPDSQPFQMATHSGKFKTYKEYGSLTFQINKKTFTLHAYQSIDLIKKNPDYAQELFIPFTDETNYKETFGGGRYIDLFIKDIKEGKITLDFNKCYNPYCAFKGGYSCPIPPKENNLTVAIKAGEKVFGKPVKE